MSLEKENNNILSDEALENVAGGELPGYTWLIPAYCESCGDELPAGYTEKLCKRCRDKLSISDPRQFTPPTPFGRL